MKRTLLTSLIAFTLAGCTTAPRGFPPVDGIQNLDRVNAQVYRSSQPDNLGLAALKSRGVRTIINLRDVREDWPAEKQDAEAAGLSYVHVPLNGWQRPSDDAVEKILHILTGGDPRHPLPALVHCQFGCDRTGTIIACYRIRHDGWTADQALREADMYGMAHSEILLRKYVRDFGRREAQSPGGR